MEGFLCCQLTQLVSFADLNILLPSPFHSLYYLSVLPALKREGEWLDSSNKETKVNKKSVVMALKLPT